MSFLCADFFIHETQTSDILNGKNPMFNFQLTFKVNVDEQPELANQFMVDAIPLVLLFKNGQLVNKSVGYRPKEQIEAMLK